MTEGMDSHELDDLLGTWVEDPEFEAAVAAQDLVDLEDWNVLTFL